MRLVTLSAALGPPSTPTEKSHTHVNMSSMGLDSNLPPPGCVPGNSGQAPGSPEC